MTPRDLQELFTSLDFTPSRTLGQNFLIDRNVSAWIVDQLEIEPGDTVIEVGPGAGALTEFLAAKATRLVLIEKDHRLARFQATRYQDRPEVTVHDTDACEFDTRALFPDQPVKLIGNLPYSAGGEIIRNFTGPHSPVCQAILMLQREVAERLCAPPGGKEFGLLTLRVQSRWIVKKLKHLGPDLFLPKPKIDSTVLSLTPRPPVEPYDARLFDSLIRQGFSQRRKQLRKNLNLDGDVWAELAGKVGIAETARAEEVSLVQWLELTRRLDDHPLKEHAQKDSEMFDVVDENDAVTGQRPRGEVHAEGLRHRATHVMVFNPAGELFLQKRSQLKDRHPGVWDTSAAGHLDAGESYEAAAIRELKEELGLEISGVEELGRLRPLESNGYEFIVLYRAVLEKRHKIRWPASEIEFGQFFPVEVVRRWVKQRPQDFAGGFLECWKIYETQSA